MTIKELRQAILDNSKNLLKPKYIVLPSAEYSALKAEIEDLEGFIGKPLSVTYIGGVTIIPEGELLDLRPGTVTTSTTTGPSTVTFTNPWTTSAICTHSVCIVSEAGKVCTSCGQTIL